MLKLPNFITKTLSVRLSLMVVLAMAFLLMASLIVMLIYARKALKHEALEDASKTLEETVQRIDNILLNVEQTSGNFYFCLLPDLDHPDMMYTYSYRMVESSPYIEGCAIALAPGFYKEGESFMAYFRRPVRNGEISSDTPIEQSYSFDGSHYTEQPWYKEPMKTGRAAWLKPSDHIDQQTGPIFTFSLPIYGRDGKPVGVVGVDVSLTLLSRIIMAAKPTPSSSCLLIDHNGSLIVNKYEGLFYQTVYEMPEYKSNSSIREATDAMISGETGFREFNSPEGGTKYVFFKPFQRTAVPGRTDDELGWTAGVIFPEEDVFGAYNRLIYYVLAIAIIGLLLLLLLCRNIIHRQLKPLLLLTESAQRIAQGHYDEVIPDSRQEDEIGRLQDNFQQMQQTLASNIGELEQVTTILEERNKRLNEAYKRTQKAERMKIAFLHNMTNQMIEPSAAIEKDVTALGAYGHSEGLHDKNKLTDDILDKGNTITELLNNLIHVSDEENGKEDGHD